MKPEELFSTAASPVGHGHVDVGDGAARGLRRRVGRWGPALPLVGGGLCSEDLPGGVRRLLHVSAAAAATGGRRWRQGRGDLGRLHPGLLGLLLHLVAEREAPHHHLNSDRLGI